MIDKGRQEMGRQTVEGKNDVLGDVLAIGASIPHERKERDVFMAGLTCAQPVWRNASA